MKNRNYFNSILIVCLMLSLASLIFYIFNFYNMPISKKTSDWSNFGSYVAGTIGPLLSLISILFVLKSINTTNDNHEALMDFSVRDKTHNQIKDLASALKEALINHYMFKDSTKQNHAPYNHLICKRVSVWMPIYEEFGLEIEDVAKRALEESRKDFESEIILILKIISLINTLPSKVREVYKLMLEVKLNNEERCVLYCFASKYFPDKGKEIQNEWPNFRGTYFAS